MLQVQSKWVFFAAAWLTHMSGESWSLETFLSFFRMMNMQKKM